MPLERAWAEWAAERSVNSRNVLAEHYMKLVTYHAAKIRGTLPELVEVEDLIQHGVFGLLGALESFDAGRRVKFATYAAGRIRGSIMDALRDSDTTPRLTRTRQKRVKRQIDRLEQEHGRPVSREEVIERGLVDAHTAGDSAVRNTVSLSRKRFENDTGRELTEVDMLSDPSAGPTATVEADDFWKRIGEGFTRAEKLILELYWRQEMTMKSIGEAVGLSESRVSQMMAQVLAILKAKLTPRAEAA